MIIPLSRNRKRLLAVLAGVAALAAINATSASAVTVQERLGQFGSHGSAAGQMYLPWGVATDPANGQVFIYDLSNNRIDEFTAWGNFVKAFGWDVAPGAVNEEQEVTLKATAGQFKLTFGASTSADIERNAPGSEAEGSGSVEATLNALASISAGGGSVSVTKGASDSSSSRYVISFDGGPLAGADVAQLSATGGTVPLSGGSPTSSAAVTTRADGTSGGTGLEACTAASGCQDGTGGTGSGQFLTSFSIVVDASGNIYVGEVNNHRVQKFDSAGRFILMFGGEVDKTTKANVCTATSGDECGAGVVGPGPGEFTSGVQVAVGPTGTVFVSDKDRIQKFEADGSFIGEIKLPGESVEALAIDPLSGDIYASYGGAAHKFSPIGSSLGVLDAPGFTGVFAVDPDGNVYVGTTQFQSEEFYSELIEFDSSAKIVSSIALDYIGIGKQSEPGEQLRALATNGAGDLYVARAISGKTDLIEFYGPAPVKFEPPPPAPPAIVGQYASSVDPEDATVAAEINSHFWTDATYYLEYGTGKCSEGGCETKPLPPGAKLTSKAIEGSVTASVLIEGLEPATTYHYRFVTQSSGGGPVRGVGGTPGLDGTETTFRTPALSLAPPPCPNDGFRTGAAAKLPDCRAYEMVSPVDKNNGDIRDLIEVTGFSVGLRQSSLDGESIAYSSYRAFAGAPAGPFSSQYIARRSADGWSTEALAPPRDRPGGADLDNEFKAFSPDLCQAWLVPPESPPLTPGALPEGINVYRRENCPGPFYEAFSTGDPPAGEPIGPPEIQGYAADSSKVVYRANKKLTPDATAGKVQLYEAGPEGLRLACILPNETPYTGNCSAGTASFWVNRTSAVTNAISPDGSRVYWSASGPDPAGTFSFPGKLYLRLGGETTLKVSETASLTSAAQFWVASADGERALFSLTEGPKARTLYGYDLGEESSIPIAGKVLGVAAQSEDLSRFYFVSEEVLPGTIGATAGKPNLYLSSEGASFFIAGLSALDVRIRGNGLPSLPSDVTPQAIYHAARATSDGEHLAFISTEPLTGYDNTDAKSAKRDSEIYLYDAESGELHCVSCNPSGARPVGRPVHAPAGTSLDTAAFMPMPTTQLYTPRAISSDGNRLFFTSYDSLLARDTNGVADAYEWERPGTGSCDEADGAFSEANGGCIYLISSGTSPSDSEVVDISEDGRDAFLTTNESLLAQDPGLIDLYDARSGGGLPPPPGQPAGCEGEACAGPVAPPNDPTPSSSAFEGAGNVREAGKAKKHHKKAHRKHTHKNNKRRTNR